MKSISREPPSFVSKTMITFFITSDIWYVLIASLIEFFALFTISFCFVIATSRLCSSTNKYYTILVIDKLLTNSDLFRLLPIEFMQILYALECYFVCDEVFTSILIVYYACSSLRLRHQYLTKVCLHTCAFCA